MVLAIVLVKTSTRVPAATKFDQLWFDFFDLFGIVWGRRIQDRVNFIANQDRLPVRLEIDGFVWTPQVVASVPAVNGSSPSGQSIKESTNDDARNAEARLEHILRWLLRRFVDPVWIDRSRLGSWIHKSDAAWPERRLVNWIESYAQFATFVAD